MDKHILESEGKQISLEKTPLLSSKCQRMLSILLNKRKMFLTYFVIHVVSKI